MSSRGYRAMAGIPRLQFAHVDLLVRSFGSLQGLLAASANDLQSVDGIGVDVGPPHPGGAVAAGRVDDRRPAGLMRVGSAGRRGRIGGASAAGAGCRLRRWAGGGGWARMNGTVADRRLPSCTTRL